MTAPRFLLAKYIPDLRRGEPRNIGVVVWTPERVVTRFLAERENLPGDVDGRSVPGFIESVNAYKQWVGYWTKAAAAPRFQPPTGGVEVARSDEAFLQALQQSSRGNFALTEAGYSIDTIPSDDLNDFAAHLYETLVASSAPEEPRDVTLDEVCDELIQETKLRQNPGFHTPYSVNCKIDATTDESFEFSYAFTNGSLQRLYQRVPIPRRKGGKALKKTVDASAWMFDRVCRAQFIKKEQGVALVYVSPDQMNDPEVNRSLHVLNSVARVVNLSEREHASDEFKALAALAGH